MSEHFISVIRFRKDFSAWEKCLFLDLSLGGANDLIIKLVHVSVWLTKNNVLTWRAIMFCYNVNKRREAMAVRMSVYAGSSRRLLHEGPSRSCCS
jgi:hypothetical protein